ncbi:MAG: hypothetical protein A3F17_07675 [Gammaproteobacteria bacterium RIFCSPHIGHO2_12_FULL_41_15]|nr:MAG: hypothetical protein A3F17_07675 [Gammaproteobacteria bacterium RIFCSPHIGHO2_12_FULL_41_15]
MKTQDYELDIRVDSSVDNELNIPDEFSDPISFEIMKEPMSTAAGYSYERTTITEWLKDHDTDPLTNKKLPHLNLVPNHNLRKLIEDHYLRKNEANQKKLPAEFLDPISHDIMREPVITADGHSYERATIQKWLETHTTSPLTNEKLPHPNLIPNHKLRSLIEDYRLKQNETSLKKLPSQMTEGELRNYYQTCSWWKEQEAQFNQIAQKYSTDTSLTEQMQNQLNEQTKLAIANGDNIALYRLIVQGATSKPQNLLSYYFYAVDFGLDKSDCIHCLLYLGANIQETEFYLTTLLKKIARLYKENKKTKELSDDSDSFLVLYGQFLICCFTPCALIIIMSLAISYGIYRDNYHFRSLEACKNDFDARWNMARESGSCYPSRYDEGSEYYGGYSCISCAPRSLFYYSLYPEHTAAVGNIKECSVTNVWYEENLCGFYKEMFEKCREAFCAHAIELTQNIGISMFLIIGLLVLSCLLVPVVPFYEKRLKKQHERYRARIMQDKMTQWIALTKMITLLLELGLQPTASQAELAKRECPSTVSNLIERYTNKEACNGISLQRSNSQLFKIRSEANNSNVESGHQRQYNYS